MVSIFFCHFTFMFDWMHVKQLNLHNVKLSLNNEYFCKAFFHGNNFQAWEADVKKLQEELRNLEGVREEDKVRVAELDVSYLPCSI